MSPARKETLRKAEEENAKNREKTRKTPVPKYAKGGKVSNFGKAFRAARERGDKEFTFGKDKKKYTTKLKEEAETPKPKAAEKPAAKKDEPEIVVTGRRKPTNMQQMRENVAPLATPFKRAAAALESVNTQERLKGASIGARREANKAEAKSKLSKSGRQMLENLGFKKGGSTKGSDMMYAKGGKTMKMAKGGSASKRADGIAKKGKTKAMMPKMAMGGRAGLDRAAAMSGRSMPASGLDRAAAMSGRTMPMTGRPGMKKGGKAKSC
jgi:hypothetical protein